MDQRSEPGQSIRVRAIFTGIGDQAANTDLVFKVRHADFGHEGVDRIQSLLMAALLSGKTVWIRFNDRTKFVTGVFLLRTRK